MPVAATSSISTPIFAQQRSEESFHDICKEEYDQQLIWHLMMYLNLAITELRSRGSLTDWSSFPIPSAPCCIADHATLLQFPGTHGLDQSPMTWWYTELPCTSYRCWLFRHQNMENDRVKNAGHNVHHHHHGRVVTPLRPGTQPSCFHPKQMPRKEPEDSTPPTERKNQQDKRSATKAKEEELKESPPSVSTQVVMKNESERSLSLSVQPIDTIENSSLSSVEEAKSSLSLVEALKDNSKTTASYRSPSPPRTPSLCLVKAPKENLKTSSPSPIRSLSLVEAVKETSSASRSSNRSFLASVGALEDKFKSCASPPRSPSNRSEVVSKRMMKRAQPMRKLVEMDAKHQHLTVPTSNTFRALVDKDEKDEEGQEEEGETEDEKKKEESNKLEKATIETKEKFEKKKNQKKTKQKKKKNKKPKQEDKKPLELRWTSDTDPIVLVVQPPHLSLEPGVEHLLTMYHNLHLDMAHICATLTTAARMAKPMPSRVELLQRVCHQVVTPKCPSGGEQKKHNNYPCLVMADLFRPIIHAKCRNDNQDIVLLVGVIVAVLSNLLKQFIPTLRWLKALRQDDINFVNLAIDNFNQWNQGHGAQLLNFLNLFTFHLPAQVYHEIEDNIVGTTWVLCFMHLPNITCGSQMDNHNQQCLWTMSTCHKFAESKWCLRNGFKH